MSIISLGRASVAALALGAAPVAGHYAASAHATAPPTEQEPSSGQEAPSEHDCGRHPDNHGAFVRSQLDEGKRGTDLAAAIHAEKASRDAGDHGRSNQPHGRAH